MHLKFHQHLTGYRTRRQSARFPLRSGRDTLRKAESGGGEGIAFAYPAAFLKMLSLQEVVDRYSSFAKQWGDPVALEAFALDPEQTIKLFTSLDEDYHISRFIKFSFENGRLYLISGNPSTHIQIDAAIRALL
jgi:hypothetical protein